MIVEQSDYKKVIGIISQWEYHDQLKLQEDIKKIMTFHKKKPIPSQWMGSLSGTGRILGDIVSPVVEEHEWEVLSS